jgi:hypothetical protein
MPDFIATNHGSIFTLTPCTEGAQGWIDEHIDTEEAQFFGKALVVEHRYIDDILHGIEQDGLEFQS